MNVTLQQELKNKLTQTGFRSLRAFYEDNRFSFTYEYLRQIVGGEKVPRKAVIKELSSALSIDEERLKELAHEADIARRINRRYDLPSAALMGKVKEKVAHYRKHSRIDAKILRTLQKLDQKQKLKVLEYVQFVNQKWKRVAKK